MALSTTGSFESYANNSSQKDTFRDFIDSRNQVTDLLLGLQEEISKENKEWNSLWNEIDNAIERIFDEYAKNNKSLIESYLRTGQTGTLLQELNSLIDKNDYINRVRNDIRELIQRDISIELDQTELDILKSSITTSNSNTPYANSSLNYRDVSSGIWNSNKKSGSLDVNNDYIEGSINTNKIWMDAMYKEGYDVKTNIYGNNYQTVSKSIENIYSDTRVRRVMEKLFDNEDGKELKRGTFRINLSKEDGLGYIILTLADHIETKNNKKIKAKKQTLYLDDLLKTTVDPSSKKTVVIGFQGFTPAIVKDLFPRYNARGTKFDDYQRIAKILNNSSWEDLYTFATLLESRSDISTTIKEWQNSLVLTGNNRDDKAPEQQETLLTEDNVFDFLCDYNSDNALSGAPIDLDKRKKQLSRKEQKNQGDVGGIFGQQLIFSIDQAIKVSDAKLFAEYGTDAPYSGENVVIQNIIKNINIADRRKRPSLDKKLTDLVNDPNKCTRKELTELSNKHPEFKQLFRAAIEKINGGPDALSPNLLDTLTGIDALRFLDTIDQEIVLKQQIDKAIKNNPNLRQLIAEQGLVYVRNTIFTHIMGVLDHVQITSTDSGENTYLRDAGIQKGRELNRVKNILLQQVIQNLITAGIHGDPSNLRISLGFARYGQTPNGKTKRGFDVGGGANFNIINGEVTLLLSIGGDIARQYNYKRVINANLDDVKSAKYIGVEGRAMTGLQLRSLGVIAEASAGVEWIQDPVTGINQINKQYTDLSAYIFDVSDSNRLSSVDDVKKAIEDNIQRQYRGKFKDFLSNNKAHFNANKNFILSYIQKNNIMQALDGKSLDDKKLAINNLLQILQGANIEEWRHDLIANLHGKVDLTKLSFGVTTSMFGWSSRQSTEGSNQYTNNADTGTAGNQSRDGEKFSLAGFYVSLRISTRRNHYVPQEKQWLMAQSRIEGGMGDRIQFKSDQLDAYAQYIQAMYNSKYIQVEVDGGKLIINSTSKTPIWQYLNIHVKKDTAETTKKINHNYMINHNSVVIGDVGDIGVYTVAEGDGVRRFLILGSKGTSGTEQITKNYDPEKEVNNADGTTSTLYGQDAMDDIKEKSEQARAMTQAEIYAIITQDNVLAPHIQTYLKQHIDAQGLFTDSSNKKHPILNGTLSIIEKPDGSVTTSLTAGTASDKTLTINYRKELPIDKRITTWDKSFDTKLLHYESDSNLRIVIEEYLNKDSFRKAIMDAEKGQETLYKAFLSNVDKYPAIAKDDLIQMLNKSKNKTEISQFIQLLDKMRTDSDVEGLSVALDGVKTILAMEVGYADRTISGLIAARKDAFTKLTGPSGEVFPPQLASLRDRRSKEATKFKSHTPKLYGNLVGYTAFYRYEQGDHKKFSLTAPGSTRVLGNFITQVPTDTEKIAQDWFLKNIENNGIQRELLKKSILQPLKTKYPTLDLSNNKLKDLIEKKETKVTIDNRDINIKIDSKMMFYLLGECANESLGIMIEKITVTEQSIYDQSVNKTIKADARMQKGYELNLVAAGESVAMKVQTEEMRLGYTHHQSIAKKEREGSNQYTEPETEGSNQNTEPETERSNQNTGLNGGG